VVPYEKIVDITLKFENYISTPEAGDKGEALNEVAKFLNGGAK